ncbi:MAG: hypothetical protein V1861_00565 [Candidatus Micrarchaeota archaeon]
MAGKDLKKNEKKSPKPTDKLIITPELRRIWVRVRQSWVTSHAAFSYGLSMLNKKQCELLYDLVRRALFRNSAGDVLKAHPEIREFMRSDDDRMCMLDVYEALSWKLDRREDPPADVKLAKNFKGMMTKRRDDPFY